MGTDALLSSGVTEKMLYLVRDSRAISPDNPLNKVRKTRIMLFLLVELLGFGATFAVTQVSPLSYSGRCVVHHPHPLDPRSRAPRFRHMLESNQSV